MKSWEELNNFTKEELKNEIWKVIDGFDGRYEVSNLGRVKSNYGKGRILKPARTRGNYWFVALKNKDKQISFRLNRLVAINFIPNPLNKPEVNQIKSQELWNNRVSNLNWMTRIENEHNDGCHDRAKEKKKIAVEMLDGTKKVIKVFNSMRDAERETGFDHSYIGKACKFNTTAYGCYWRYADGERRE